ELYGIERDNLLPTLYANGALTRERLPDALSPTGQKMTATVYSVNPGVAAWEIDFFGRIRNLSAAAFQDYLATEQGRRSVQIMLVSGVSRAWLALGADQENLRLAQSTLEAQRSTYSLIKNLLDRGVAPEIDLDR